jgi:hypothetical protein
VYDMSMLTKRLQVLVTPQQRRRLATEAQRRGSSVGELVREAIDSIVGGISAEARQRAVEEIARMEPRKFVAPDELDRLIESEHELPLRRAAKTTRR